LLLFVILDNTTTLNNGCYWPIVTMRKVAPAKQNKQMKSDRALSLRVKKYL